MLDSQNIQSSPLKGGILGVCVGDALGLPVQFASRKDRKKKPVTDMIGYGVFNLPPGSWSDDSSLTLCLVDAIIQVYPTQKDQLLKQVAANFCRWYTEGYWTPYQRAYDIGGATRKAVERLRKGVSPKESGGTSEYSNGNGSLMRILPLAFCSNLLSFTDLIELTHSVSAITHGHLRSQIACGIYISIAIQLLNQKSPKEAYQTGIEAVKSIYSQYPYASELSHYSRVMEGNLDQLSEDKINASGYVVDALEASLWSWLTTDTYADAVLKAVNLGEDTDTTAAITGGLAGIQCGVEAIPSHWLEQLVRVEDILALINHLEEKLSSL